MDKEIRKKILEKDQKNETSLSRDCAAGMLKTFGLFCMINAICPEEQRITANVGAVVYTFGASVKYLTDAARHSYIMNSLDDIRGE